MLVFSTLRAGVVLTCVGAAGGFVASGQPVLACAALLGAIAALGAKRAWIFVLIAIAFAIDALLAGSPFDRAIRYVGPLAMAALLAGDSKRANQLLTWGSAIVFATHGIEALTLDPKFIDYLVVTIDKVTGFRMAQSAAELHLYAIGTIDVILAVLVVLRPSKAVWGYMAFWGISTAVMRSIYFGPVEGWHLTLIRALNGGAPLALLVMAGAVVHHLDLATADRASVRASPPIP